MKFTKEETRRLAVLAGIDPSDFEGTAHHAAGSSPGNARSQNPPIPRPPYQDWPRTFRLEIPGWIPASGNDLRRHPLVQGRLKARDAKAVAKAAAILGIPNAISRRRVELIVRHPRWRRMPDDDAYVKSCWDALVRAGVLVDDRREWLEFSWPPDYGVGPLGTTILLADQEPRWNPGIEP